MLYGYPPVLVVWQLIEQQVCLHPCLVPGMQPCVLLVMGLLWHNLNASPC